MSVQTANLMNGLSAAEWRKRIQTVLIKSRRYRDIDYSAARLAEDLGVTPSVLSRILRTTMECNYTDLVNAKRVDDAKKMLANTNYLHYTVDEIGLLAGFRNRQSFFTAFAKHADTTPRNYRDTNINY